MNLARILGITLAIAMGGSVLVGQDAVAQDWRKQFPKFRYGVQAVETQAAALTRYKGFGIGEYVKQKLGVELELFLSAEYARRHPGDRREAARSDGYGRERLRRRLG